LDFNKRRILASFSMGGGGGGSMNHGLSNELALSIEMTKIRI
jgi:hypothetical protein